MGHGAFPVLVFKQTSIKGLGGSQELVKDALFRWRACGRCGLGLMKTLNEFSVANLL